MSVKFEASGCGGGGGRAFSLDSRRKWGKAPLEGPPDVHLVGHLVDRTVVLAGDVSNPNVLDIETHSSSSQPILY
jgi:hypothetical protein